MDFSVSTGEKYQIVNISDQVSKAVKDSNAREGVVVVFVPHTSAAVMVNEDEEGLKQDFYALFKDYEDRPSRHPDGNAGAHMWAGVIGHSRVIPIEGGRLALGTWQSVLFVELDGPRERRVTITVLPSQKGI